MRFGGWECGKGEKLGGVSERESSASWAGLD
jgi:hypothetical protein